MLFLGVRPDPHNAPRGQTKRRKRTTEPMAASDLGVEASANGEGTVKSSGEPPVGNDVNSKSVVDVGTNPPVVSEGEGANPPDAPRTPAMSDEAPPEEDVDDLDYDHDESFALDEDDDEMDLTAEMARLGLKDEDDDVEGTDSGDERPVADASFDLNDSRDFGGDDEEEAEVRRRMDAELEMNLRRAELKHVELELKLVTSEENVRLAKEALAKAEAERDEVQRQAHAAWGEVGEVEKLIGEERARREEEDAAKALAAHQARAVVEADDLRQRGNEAYRRGDSAEAETAYKQAIDALQSCDIALVEPSHLTLRTNRAAALMSLGRTREALQECEEVLRINPHNVRALSRAGNCCVKLGDLDAAKTHVDSICLAPGASAEDLKAAGDQNQKILVASVERDRLVGNDSYRRGDYDEALRWYNAALDAAKDVSETDALRAVKVGLHTNRAAALLMKGRPLPAAEDCCSALRLDSTHTKAQVRLSRCLLQLGDFAEARQEATDVLDRTNAELQSKSEAHNVIKDIETVEGAVKDVGDKLKLAEIKSQAERNKAAGGMWVDDFDVAAVAKEGLQELAGAMVLAPMVPDLITLQAEALRFLRRHEEALQLLSGKKSVNARRKFLEIRLHFDVGDVAACIQAGAEVQHLLDLIPELKAAAALKRENGEPVKEEKKKENDEEEEEDEQEQAMADLAMVPDPEGLLMLLEKATKISTCKDDGRAAFKSGRHQEALALYNEALQMSCGVPALEGLFLSNICACEQALGRYADALSSAGTAVAVAPSFVKAHSRLATIYSELGMLSDAQAAYRTMMQLSLDDKEETQARTNLASVTARAKNDHPIDWIALLGVETSAGAADVKKAYRQLALVHHPDKAGKGGVSATVAKARAEMSGKIFKYVGEANRVLTDASERAKWESAKARAERADRMYSTARSGNAHSTYHDAYTDRYDHYASAAYYHDMYDDMHDEYGDVTDNFYYD